MSLAGKLNSIECDQIRASERVEWSPMNGTSSCVRPIARAGPRPARSGPKGGACSGGVRARARRVRPPELGPQARRRSGSEARTMAGNARRNPRANKPSSPPAARRRGHTDGAPAFNKSAREGCTRRAGELVSCVRARLGSVLEFWSC